MHPWLSHGLIVEQHGGEFVPFLEYLQTIRVQRVLEIGVRRGGTAATWCEMTKSYAQPLVVGLDWPEKDGLGRAESEKVARQLLTTYPHYKCIFGDSHDGDTVKLVGKYAPFDLLFIDGDHSLAGVECDYMCYSPMVSSRGIIAMHDIVDSPFTRSVNCRVSEFWKRLVPHMTEHYEFLIGADWGGIGAVRLP